jgi:hypothetical protein
MPRKAYAGAVSAIFSDDIDYAQLDKIYGAEPEGQRGYSPPKCVGIKRKVITGNPDMRHASTSWNSWSWTTKDTSGRTPNPTLVPCPRL